MLMAIYIQKAHVVSDSLPAKSLFSKHVLKVEQTMYAILGILNTGQKWKSPSTC